MLKRNHAKRNHVKQELPVYSKDKPQLGLHRTNMSLSFQEELTHQFFVRNTCLPSH